MTHRMLAATAAISILAFPLAAAAQNSGAAAGAATGAVTGAVVGGPIGAVVGGVAGAAIGGGLSEEQRPRFRQYVVQQKRPSYHYKDELRVGAELPASGVTYYDVPSEYGVRDYRYTVINDRTVLVDPRSHKVVQVIE